MAQRYASIAARMYWAFVPTLLPCCLLELPSTVVCCILAHTYLLYAGKLNDRPGRILVLHTLFLTFPPLLWQVGRRQDFKHLCGMDVQEHGHNVFAFVAPKNENSATVK